jgi:hypothetical protein
MNNSTWQQLEAFVRREVGIRESRPLKHADRLEDDLDLSGDDADIFMGKFFDRFPVQPGDYDFARYFSEEGFNLFLILAMPFSKKLRQRYDKAPLTVGMLECAIRLGVWDSAELARYNREGPDAR